MKNPKILTICFSAWMIASSPAAEIIVFDTAHSPESGTTFILGGSVGGSIDRPVQRFTTDASVNLTIQGIGVVVTGIENPYNFPFGAGQLHAEIYTDENGLPAGGANIFDSVQSLGKLSESENQLHIGENWLYGNVSLSPNTSYWVAFDLNPDGYDSDYASSANIALTSGGSGDWLHPADHISILYDGDDPGDPTYYSIQFPNQMVQMEIVASIPEPSCLFGFSSVVAIAAMRRRMIRPSKVRADPVRSQNVGRWFDRDVSDDLRAYDAGTQLRR